MGCQAEIERETCFEHEAAAKSSACGFGGGTAVGENQALSFLRDFGIVWLDQMMELIGRTKKGEPLEGP